MESQRIKVAEKTNLFIYLLMKHGKPTAWNYRTRNS